MEDFELIINLKIVLLENLSGDIRKTGYAHCYISLLTIHGETDRIATTITMERENIEIVKISLSFS